MTISAQPSQVELTPSQRRRGLTAVLIRMTVIGVNVISLSLEARGLSATFNGINTALLYIAAIVFAPVVPRLARKMDLLGGRSLAQSISPSFWRLR